MHRILLIAIAFLTAASASALNPLDHATLLNDNDQHNPATTKDDDEEDPYFLLTGEAEQAMADGDLITAVLRIKDALRLQPENPANVMLLSNLGIIYSVLDQDSLAIQSYNQALEIAPSMTTIRLNRGLAHLKVGQQDEALRDLCSVIERDSTNVTARYYRGMLALYSRDLPTATADINVLQTTDPDNPNTWIAMATLLSATGDDRAAIPYYKKLLERDNAAEYYCALAASYLAIDDLLEASAVLGKGIAAYPDDADLYAYRALLNKKYFRFDDSRADADHAIDLGADPQRVAALLK